LKLIFLIVTRAVSLPVVAAGVVVDVTPGKVWSPGR
jgi:hypothetical protein